MMPDPFSSAMSSVATAEPRQGQFGKWDVYPLIWRETSTISDRRQTANTLYLSVNSILLGAIALLAQQSKLQSISLLILEVFVAIAGLLISTRWNRVLAKYQSLLKVRYKTLSEIEAMPGFPGAVKMFTIEDQHPETWGYSAIEQFLPRTFTWLYVVGSLLFIGGTIAVRIHLGIWLMHYITIPTLQ